MPSVDLSSLGSSSSLECGSLASSDDSLLTLLDDDSSHKGFSKRQRTTISPQNYFWGMQSANPATKALEASLLLSASPPDELFSFEIEFDLESPNLGAQVVDLTSGMARLSAKVSASSVVIASRSL
jgi:hypothetical protein